MNATVTVTVQLYQEGGVAGPRGQIETTEATALDDAVAWAHGQVGWPWDGMLVNVRDDNDQHVETYQIEFHGNSWEVV